MSSTLEIPCTDGATLSAAFFAAESPKATLVVGSALGVGHRYYQRFAECLSADGINVMTFDYRMTGENAAAAASARLASWGQLDIDAAISHALSLGQPVSYIGHSIGGQLLGLAPSATQLDRAILVAASAPYWRRWAFPDNLKMLATSKAVFPLVASLSKEFPSQRFGLGNLNIPSPIFKDWCRYMAAEDYLFDKKFGLETSGYKSIECPLLSLGFSDDALAPEANLEYLLRFYPKAQSQLQMISPQEIEQRAIGHTGMFRDKMQDSLWQQVIEFLG